MHMISKKDLDSAEVVTLMTSRSPTTVTTANGEVQTHQEAAVYVKELFVTMKVLEDTPAVLSLGKLCDESGYSYEWINGQKPHLIKNGIRIQCNTENFVPIVVPGLSSSSSRSSSTSKTPSRQESPCSTSSSSSSSSLSVGEISVQEREDVPLENEKMELTMTPLQCKCQLRLMIDQGNLILTQPIKIQKQIKRNPRGNRATRCILRSRNGCKNSGKFWWMMKFQNMEHL